MRHSSRIFRILAFLAVIPTSALAGGAVGHVSSVGSARGLSPIHPMVGSARGLSPVTPVVGTARNLSPIRADAEGRRRFARGHLFRDRTIGGSYGDLGLAGVDLYGAGLAYTANPDGVPVDGSGLGPDENPRVLLAPPPPCVHPQIISVGRSVYVERRAAKRSGVRVVYGRPPCGSY